MSDFVTAPLSTRNYSINMPQMALGGLSESWLFKELGDIHWRMISDNLGQPSHLLVDAKGDRLYATFTRLQVVSSAPLVRVSENSRGTATGRLRRFGTGVFFGEIDIALERDWTASARLMSSFTKRSRAASNASLLKGQPIIPETCPVPVIDVLPDFGQEHRQRRSLAPASPLFSCEYEIIPYYDINGVGLLYFATYPMINDICELKFMERGLDWALDSSTVKRDVFYFGNCDLSDRIVYRVHVSEAGADSIRIESSLSRSSDNLLMAYIVTEKALLSERTASA